ncbi:sulfur reduction protein DsrE [Christiangramia fulva]|uniref:Sulfur reduction protein DsrE n=1 Tax=Christiangramia fulva TaxID=2126553 RepID=A0A2R3ZB38_9FLAO|nr:DsrE family protein [Christiangramia fulva]AVR47496.1 sulfur reduction protein DsrE [Christiangramia fulva]
MKKLILGVFLLTLAFSNALIAQTSTHEHHSHNYVVLTKKIPQLQPIILTAEALAEEDGESFGDFQAIICGKTVQELTDKEMMKSFIEKAEEAHVKIVVCGFSLKKFKVNKEDIPEELEVVDNGILHDFQLQKKGYLSIEL